jgi:hypothetical protein
LIYINYDRFSPDALNRASAWEGGGVVLAHEIGHYFGLLHTFEGGCNPPDDAVTDTPPNLDPESGWQPAWLTELTDWCKRFRKGEGPDPKQLMKYKSCPNRGGKDVVDNVFNMMSYLDDVCRMSFTENQVGADRRQAAGGFCSSFPTIAVRCCDQGHARVLLAGDRMRVPWSGP